MRIRLPLGRSLFFTSVFLFAIVALLPLRLALDWLGFDERGFAAREARGSIWLGGLTEAQMGGIALGDLQTRLRTLPLLAGRARIDLTRHSEADPFTGSVPMARNRFGVDDVSAKLKLGSAVGPLPLGTLDLTDLSVHFADGGCASAEGMVKASVAGDVAGLPLAGGLSGAARCDGRALLLPLVSQSGVAAVNLRLSGDGAYVMEFAVTPSDDAMRDRLLASGFSLAGNGYTMSATGKF
ncbi:type II secretion system protein N [Allosphingosinicella humi]